MIPQTAFAIYLIGIDFGCKLSVEAVIIHMLSALNQEMFYTEQSITC